MFNRVRILAFAWGASVDVWETFCLPSLLSPGNLPAVLRDGLAVQLDLYTVDTDEPRIRALGERIASELAPLGSFAFSVGTWPQSQRPISSADLKMQFYRHHIAQVVQDGSAVIFGMADVFFGDGSLRNIVRLARFGDHPVVGAVSLRVREQPFRELMRRYRETIGPGPISNAHLVDLALRCPIAATAASYVDSDRNSSFHTGGSLLPIDDELTLIGQALTYEMLQCYTTRDFNFFAMNNAFEAIDHVWPTLLLAEQRIRLATSSDIYFSIELTDDEVEGRLHTYPVEDGRLLNDTFQMKLLHSDIFRLSVSGLRREPLPL